MPGRRSALSETRRPACDRGCARSSRARRRPASYGVRAAARGCRRARASDDEGLLLELAVVALERLVLAAQQRLYLLHDLFEVERPHPVLQRPGGELGPGPHRLVPL